MRSHARILFLALLTGVLLAGVLASSASAATEFPLIEKFVATNCTVSTCGQETVLGPFSEPKATITPAEAKAEGFAEPGGRVPFGVTDFKVFTLPEIENEEGEKVTASYATGTVEPTSIVEHLRTDVAPGLATNPFAVDMCSMNEFGEEGDTEVEPVTGTHFFVKVDAACNVAKIGTQSATVFAGIPEQPGFEEQKGGGDLPLTGTVYDLEPGGEETMANGSKLAALYGVALELPKPLTEQILKGLLKGSNKPVEEGQYYAHTLIKGSVEWGKEARGTNAADYHDYFEIAVSPSLPLIRSRLVFEGTIGNGAFISNATSCPGNLTTSLHMADKEGVEAPVAKFTTPVGLGEISTQGTCEDLEFPISFNIGQSTTLTDQPDELTAEAAEAQDPSEPEPSQVKSATFTLPEGMTLNPSAAHGLEACRPAEANEVAEGTGVFSETFGVSCPVGSKIGTVELEVPTLPDGSLSGSVYLAGPASGPITDPPYIVYVVADSAKYGISVRLRGETIPNATTGQVTAVFPHTPEQPFTSINIHFDRGVLAPVANPLICGKPEGSSTFEPTATPFIANHTEAFGTEVTGCAETIPFALTQSTESEPNQGGGHSSWTYNVARSDGNQYLAKVKTVLPPGLVGAIPDVTLCGEPQAAKGECTAASKIGTVTAESGSGSSPYTFTGAAYMTGPFEGAPYGLSIVVPATAGPFALGNIVSRATINVDPITAQVISNATVPTIVKGIPVRLRKLSVNVNRQGFLFNPTSCEKLSTISELTSTTGTVQKELSSPFQVENCSALKFKPTFSASTSGKYSKKSGASLVTKITQPEGQANIKSVVVQLPKQLPSRLETLQKSCTEATFAANPLGCPASAIVGSATVITPTLPGKVTGPAVLVSHGGRAFPDLDLVLEDQGVRVILTGKTDINEKTNVTTSSFLTNPDVPVSSVEVNLGLGPHSALSPFGNLCKASLVMPTTITAQNGATFKQNTTVAPTSCAVQVVGHKVVGRTLYLTVKTFAAGRVTASGKGLKTVRRSFGAAHKKISLKVPLSSGGRQHHKPFRTKVRIGFAPKKGAKTSNSIKVTFRH